MVNLSPTHTQLHTLHRHQSMRPQHLFTQPPRTPPSLGMVTRSQLLLYLAIGDPKSHSLKAALTNTTFEPGL